MKTTILYIPLMIFQGSCRGHNSRLAEVYEKDQSDYLLGIARSLGGNNETL